MSDDAPMIGSESNEKPQPGSNAVPLSTPTSTEIVGESTETTTDESSTLPANQNADIESVKKNEKTVGSDSTVPIGLVAPSESKQGGGLITRPTVPAEDHLVVMDQSVSLAVVPEPPPPAHPVSETKQTTLPDAVVMEKSRTLWREVDPSDPTDKVEHTDKDFKMGPCGTWLVAASRRGRSHAQDGKYREDAFALAIVNDWILAAVADGTGSKPLARVGARVSAEGARDYLKGLMENSPEFDIEEYLYGALAGAMVHALAQVSAEAARRRREVNDLASTLLLVAFRDQPGSTWLGVAQVGDGEITVHKQNGEYKVLGKSDHGKYAGEALFLTSPETQLTWSSRVFVYQVEDPYLCAVVATDGVMDDFMPPYGKLENLYEFLQPLYTANQPEQWLLDWLAYERRGSFDDRTLVALVPNKRQGVKVA